MARTRFTGIVVTKLLAILKRKRITNTKEERMVRMWAIVAGFFLFAWVPCVAADNSSDFASESQTTGSPEQSNRAKEISSLQEEVQEVQSEYESWAARVDQTLQNLNKAQDTPGSRIQVTEDNQSELPQVDNEGVDVQKKQDTLTQAAAVSHAIAASSSRKASAEVKSNSSVEKKEKTNASAAKINQNQKLPNTPSSTAPNQGNIFIGVPLAPNQQKTSINSDTSPSKGVRIVYPKVTVVGGTNSDKK